VPTVLAELVSLLVPPSCVGCRSPLARGTVDLCGSCRRRLRWLRDACPRCGLPRPCGRRCPAARAAFDSAWSPLVHAGPARRLVVVLKHDGRLVVARTMAAHVVAGAPLGLLAPPAVLVPVPVDPWRGRTRGFDHARRLADAISARTGLPVVPGLRRGRSSTAQAGRDRGARLRAGQEARIVSDGTAGPRVVLVDDVHTTGATLDACARALRATGTRRVDAVTYTRALR